RTMKWYEGITRYQWLVLVVCCLGWIFDVFEGQIFVASMRDAMPALLGTGADNPAVSKWNDSAFGMFLLGGALGGVFFGMLSDRIGRAKTMVWTILFYSLFTCLSAFSKEPWHLVALRFLVAMGVGGEWAVASAMVAEVMPKRSRAVMSSIFHASSVFGTLLAVAAIRLLIANEEVNQSLANAGFEGWRIGFAVGALPALLTIWIRWKMREPDTWQAAKERERKAGDSSEKTGKLSDLFDSANLRNTIICVGLATIGLVTFWGIHIYGKNALLEHAKTEALVANGLDAGATAAQKSEIWNVQAKSTIKKAEMTSMAINTIGGGLGLVLFGWISNRLGRKGAFYLYHIAAFICVIILFKILIPGGASAAVLMVFLPIFGFFTLGMHAGYAVYFPELYPTKLRGTGAGFGFNMGRLGTAAAFFGFAALANPPTPINKALILSPLYLLALALIFFARETRDSELPE
ncbi:MAG: MFS transporter, partial [Verrucomicrobiales bacterium]|nr:MFS transporter [Verrucomicrobiales bacterium]